MTDYIQEYFTNSTDPSKEAYWRPRYLDDPSPKNLKEYDTIVNEILDSESVLDVGCGYHPFKGRIKKLIGIDKYNPAADLLIDMLDFEAEDNSFDVVIALGATNLHSFELIDKQIEKIVRWCKPEGRIYMRVNPGLEEVITPKFNFCKWTIQDIGRYTNYFNLEIIKPVELTENLRYIWTWKKQK